MFSIDIYYSDVCKAKLALVAWFLFTNLDPAQQVNPKARRPLGLGRTCETSAGWFSEDPIGGEAHSTVGLGRRWADGLRKVKKKKGKKGMEENLLLEETWWSIVILNYVRKNVDAVVFGLGSKYGNGFVFSMKSKHVVYHDF